MELHIRQLSDGENSLDSLAQWLQGDADLARQAHIQPVPTEAPGRMGGWLEALNIVLTHGEALAALALSYAAWRSQHPQAASIIIVSNDQRLVNRTSGPTVADQIINLFGRDHQLGNTEGAEGDNKDRSGS